MPGPLDDDPRFAPPPGKARAIIVGENVDDLSAHDLAERIEGLRAEIARIEALIRSREATRAAAAAAFKS